MQKLKNIIVDKLFNSNLTSTEINVLIFISQFQGARGNVMGVYYKDVRKNINCSIQAFYNAINGLKNKGFIMIQKESYYDMDILILDNDFSRSEAHTEGYISTGYDLIQREEFYSLKAGEKTLLLFLFKLIGSAKGKVSIGVKKLYKILEETMGIKKRCVQNYLKSLKKFLNINISEGKYWFTVKKKKKIETDRGAFSSNMAKVVCRRNRAVTSHRTFKDTVDLIYQYCNDFGERLQVSFSAAFQKAIYSRNENKKNKYKWNREVHPAFVHKLLRQELGLEIA